MKTFFILSLPRSRTAWFANFLTYGESFCFHEGLLQTSHPFQLRDLFNATGKNIVGNSDCGNIFFYEELKELYPDAVFIHIKRDLDDVIESLNTMTSDFRDYQTVEMANALLSEIDIPTFRFDDIDESACRKIWELCIGTPFDRKRWEMLDGINMTIDEDKKMKQIHHFEQNVIELRKEMQ